MSGARPETKDGIALALWSIAGVAGTVGLFSLGPAAWTLSAGLILFAIVAKLPARVDALLVGAAIPLLVIALDNATGPGWSCHSGPAESGCDELLDPRPFHLGLSCSVSGSQCERRCEDI